MIQLKQLYILPLLFISLFTSLACVDDNEFVIPPIICSENFVANATISEVIGLNTTNVPDLIDEDILFEGYVISSDKAGNFFSTISLQDSPDNPTKGLQVEIDVSDLFTQFPLGSRVIVSVKGLYINNDAGVIKIGQTFDDDGELRVGRISEVFFNNHIFRTCDDLVEATPKVFNSISEALSEANLNNLVRIEGVQVQEICDGETYFQEDNAIGSATNVIVIDRNGDALAMRNSRFASFAEQLLPTGSGSITGVLSAFSFDPPVSASEFQLFIRDTDDVKLTQERFNTSGTNRITIQELRDIFMGSAINELNFDENTFIQGTVISDRSNNSITARNIFLQDETAGILVRFDDNNIYDINATINVRINDVKLSAFNGLLQLSNVPNDNATQECEGISTIQPTDVTISEILTGDFESQLIRLTDISFQTPGNSYGGPETITDGTNNITMFTAFGFTDLANQNTPSGTLNITAIASSFNGAQIVPRGVEEVGGTPPTVNTEIPFVENFLTQIPGGWQTIATTGTNVWEFASFGGDTYARESAFGGSGNPILDIVTWMITNEMDFDVQSNETMTLQVADAFSNGNPLQVFYSTNYSGSGDPSIATWTRIGESEISSLNENTGSFDNNFEETAEIDLSGITGTGYIAFVYDSADGTISTTIDIGQVRIQ